MTFTYSLLTFPLVSFHHSLTFQGGLTGLGGLCLVRMEQKKGIQCSVLEL